MSLGGSGLESCRVGRAKGERPSQRQHIAFVFQNSSCLQFTPTSCFSPFFHRKFVDSCPSDTHTAGLLPHLLVLTSIPAAPNRSIATASTASTISFRCGCDTSRRDHIRVQFGLYSRTCVFPQRNAGCSQSRITAGWLTGAGRRIPRKVDHSTKSIRRGVAVLATRRRML